MIVFHQLENPAAVAHWSGSIAKWVHTTGATYFDTLFGDVDTALLRLESWVRRPDSEFSGMRATLALNGGQGVGVFIALPGLEVPKRRSVDTLHLLKECRSDRRLALRGFLSAFANVLLPVAESEFYLRTLAVDVDWRGRGVGRQLLEEAIAAGGRVGFKRIRLDVNANNAPALRLYERLGFKIIHKGAAPDYGQHVCAMLLER